MSAIWSHFGLNNAKSSCNIVVLYVVLILVSTGTSQTNVVEGLSESVMDHLIIVLMNIVNTITNQQEFVLMETGRQCFFLFGSYRLLPSKTSYYLVWNCLNSCDILHRVSKKRPTFTTCYNFYIHSSIATIFGTNVAKKVGNQNILYFPTSPN